MVQWLRVHASTAGVQVCSLVKELRSHMLRGTAKNKTKQNTSLSKVLEFYQKN